jgi:ATP-dependent RNA helicase DBP3
LERRGMRVASIHGDLRQEQRTRSLEAFKSGTTTVLVATDVAARGLDIPEVKLVINVTVGTNSPEELEQRKLTQCSSP